MTAVLSKLKHFFCAKKPQPLAPSATSDELTPEDIRQRAVIVSAAVNAWERCPAGLMASVPKTARAFEFYMRAPVKFRYLVNPAFGMQAMLRMHDIHVPVGALHDPAAMLPYWQAMEALLPDGPSIHEKWAQSAIDRLPGAIGSKT